MTKTETMKILIPLDGSLAADAAVEAIRPLIPGRRVEVTLLHVAEDAELRKEVEGRLRAGRETLEKEQIPVRVVVVPGTPTEEILRYARQYPVDLIVMNTHGRTGMEHVLMGSVAEAVARRSPVPTLLCRAAADTRCWARILVALDGSPAAESVLTDAVALARGTGASVHLVRVGLSLLRSDCYQGSAFEFPEEPGTVYLEQIAARLRAEGVSAVVESCSGMAGVEIPKIAKILEAGLICMTTEGRPDNTPWFAKSVAAEVIRSAPCPVYVRRKAAQPAATPGPRR